MGPDVVRESSSFFLRAIAISRFRPLSVNSVDPETSCSISLGDESSCAPEAGAVCEPPSFVVATVGPICAPNTTRSPLFLHHEIGIAVVNIVRPVLPESVRKFVRTPPGAILGVKDNIVLTAFVGRSRCPPGS